MAQETSPVSISLYSRSLLLDEPGRAVVRYPAKETLNESIMQFISEWNKHAHPFNRSTKSAAKIMAGAPVKKAA